MFEDYKIAVLNFYREQNNKRVLSTDLENPNRERLRKECAAVFLRKSSKKDKDLVQSFFDPQEKYSDQLRSIEQFNLDKFRPLVSFLTQEEGQARNLRDDNNVKLLAWLLSFPEYEDWRNGILGETGIADPDGGKGDDGKKDEDTEGEENRDEDKTQEKDGDVEDDRKKDNPNTKIKIEEVQSTVVVNTLLGNFRDKPEDPSVVVIAPPVVSKKRSFSITFKITISFLILFIVGIAYGFWKKNKDKTIRQPLPTEQCMYWTGIHYEPISCNENVGNKLILPLDKEQLANQQKITIPDTLNTRDLDKTWYSKINGKVDFYTDSGTNPHGYGHRRLLPLTQYMLNKYVSYDRYLLNVVVWSISLVVLFGLLIAVSYKFRPKKAIIR